MRHLEVQRLHTQAAALLQCREPLLLTRRGQPMGIFLPLDGSDWEDLVLALHPKLQRAWAAARRQLARGEFVTLEELRARTGGKG